MQQLTPNPSFSLTIRVQLLNRAGMLSSVIGVLAEAGGNLGQIDLIQQTRKISVRDITVNAYSTEHMDKLIAVVKAVPEIRVLEVYDRTFQVHKGGKIHLEAKVAVKGQDDLAMVYTPGVGRVCMAIAVVHTRRILRSSRPQEIFQPPREGFFSVHAQLQLLGNIFQLSVLSTAVNVQNKN